MKEKFLNLHLQDIDSFYSFLHDQMMYGWVDFKGMRHKGVNDGHSYSLQSPEELIISKLGICWDMTELCRTFFEVMTPYKIFTYYLFYDDHKGCPSHTILVFYKDEHVYWFEPMFHDFYAGIHEYANLEELLQDFISKFLEYNVKFSRIPENYDVNAIFLYRYDKPKYHINGFEMGSFIRASEQVFVRLKR